MRKVLAVLVIVLLAMAASTFAEDQGGGAIKPGIGYRFTIAENPEVEIQTSTIVEIAGHYLVPLTANGEWNLQVVGGSGVANDLTNAIVGIGGTYAPEEVQNVMIGMAMFFDVTFPTDAFRDAATLTAEEIDAGLKVTDDEAWLSMGVEAQIDFKAAGLPGSLVMGWGRGFRGKPDQAYFAFQIPMSAESTEDRVKRSP